MDTDRRGARYRNLLNISLVSRKFNRLTEPYLYRSVVLSEQNKHQFLYTTDVHAQLSRHTRQLVLTYSHDISCEVQGLAVRLPNVHRLHLDITYWNLSDLLPVLQLPSITTLRLSGVIARRIPHTLSANWKIANTSITDLDMSFSDPDNWWESCNELWKFAAIFRSLRSLSTHSDYEPGEKHVMNGLVCWCLVHAFRHAFETSLRSFSFGYDIHHGARDPSDRNTIDAFDARAILEQSHLEHLKIDTLCLHRPMPRQNLRSLDLGLSCLPPSLRTLYLRHLVTGGNLNRTDRNLMHSNEAQCLSQLVNLGTRKARFPHIEKLTMTKFLPMVFNELGSRIVRGQARKVKLPLELMLVPTLEHGVRETAISWPEYDASRDPRRPIADPTFTRFTGPILFGDNSH